MKEGYVIRNRDLLQCDAKPEDHARRGLIGKTEPDQFFRMMFSG